MSEISGTSQIEADNLIPKTGGLHIEEFRANVVDAVALALDKAFAEGIEHVESVEFLKKVAELAKRSNAPEKTDNGPDQQEKPD